MSVFRRSNCISSFEMTTEDSTTPAVSASPAATKQPVVTKSRSSSLALILIGLLVAIIAGGGVWFVVQHDRTTEAARKAESSSAPKYLIHLEGFTVNLADPEETHFLRVTMDLGVDQLPEGADREKMTTLLPVARIRDSILSVLTVCKADSLLTPEGKTQLKKNLVNVLSQNVPELGVREVYFTEFLVQR
jgi:flagellar FliL protein